MPLQDGAFVFHSRLNRASQGEYLDIEFKPRGMPKFEYNLERIIDDFILFCVLVGNDFLPCLPYAEIGESGLDDLFRVYKDHLSSATTSPWLTKDCGEVDFEQLPGGKHPPLTICLLHRSKVAKNLPTGLFTQFRWQQTKARQPPTLANSEKLPNHLGAAECRDSQMQPSHPLLPTLALSVSLRSCASCQWFISKKVDPDACRG